MDRLKSAKLFGAGLIEVDTPVMVGRYNSCLEQLGIAPTALESFSIDCVGWSPEIAAEKGSPLYLSHGIPNQLAIILTPDQRKRPIYYPFNSFERRMVDAFFKRYGKEIADITATNAVAVTMDQGISDYGSPMDLLLVDHVYIRASTDGELMGAALGQKTLVHRIMTEKESWFDPKLRSATIDSAKKYGDLRQRRIEIPAMRFDDLRSFYSEAFQGVFVFRTEEEKDDLLVVQNKDVLGKRMPKNVFWMQDPKLVDRLLDEGIFDIDFEWYRNNPAELEYRMECMAADALCSCDPKLSYSRLSAPAKKKKMLEVTKAGQPSAYFKVERVRKVLEREDDISWDNLSLETKLALIHPHGDLPPWYRAVVWQLICRLTQYDPLRMYVTDKNRFFDLYQTWHESKREWVSETLARLYRPHSTRSE